MTQQSLTLELWSSALPRSFALTRLSGYEAISECFDFELQFDRTSEEVDVEGCLRPGSRAAIVFKSRGEVVRVIHGCLLELGTKTDLDGDPNESQTTWVARFAPRLWSAKFNIRTEVYEGRVQDIVRKVLLRSGLLEDLDYEFRLTEEYPRREFVLQYHESDFAFASRVLEHWGIAFSFEHGSRDRVIFSDQNSGMLDVACAKCSSDDEGSLSPENPGEPPGHVTTLPFRQFSGGEEVSSGSVASHGRSARRVPASFMTHDY